jgi:hypothetical protein
VRCGGVAFAADADVAKKQAEIQKAAKAALERFYKADPKLKAQVDQSPGYAVVTSFGISFISVGPAAMASPTTVRPARTPISAWRKASAGVQVGAAQTDTLMIFKTPAALAKFIDKGWEFGGAAVRKRRPAARPSVQAGGGENTIADANYYTLTKNGLQVGGAFAGTKFWKNKDLN